MHSHSDGGEFGSYWIGCISVVNVIGMIPSSMPKEDKSLVQLGLSHENCQDKDQERIKSRHLTCNLLLIGIKT